MKRLPGFSQLCLLILVFLITILACSQSISTGSESTSFDHAHLLMITSRSILDLYNAPEEQGNIPVRESLVTWSLEGKNQSTLEQLNQQMALANEYQRLADIARFNGNATLTLMLENKANHALSRAEKLEQIRKEWRRNHRWNMVIRRGMVQIGQAIGHMINYSGNLAGSYWESRINDQISNIIRFIRDPIRYSFDVKITRLLQIVKNQFIDRLGPFVGVRIYTLLGVEERAWELEKHIFKPTRTRRNQVIQPPAIKTIEPTPDFEQTKTTISATFIGVWNTNWGVMVCDLAGSGLSCEYEHDKGRIDATVSIDGRTMEGTWSESPSYAPPHDGGRVEFILSSDGNMIEGEWWYGNEDDGKSDGRWVGTRTNE